MYTKLYSMCEGEVTFQVLSLVPVSTLLASPPFHAFSFAPHSGFIPRQECKCAHIVDRSVAVDIFFTLLTILTQCELV